MSERRSFVALRIGIAIMILMMAIVSARANRSHSVLDVAAQNSDVSKSLLNPDRPAFNNNNNNSNINKKESDYEADADSGHEDGDNDDADHISEHVSYKINDEATPSDDNSNNNNNNNNNVKSSNDKINHVVPAYDKDELMTYRKMYINDWEINLEEADHADRANLIKAYFQDDLQFECDVPREKAVDFDWSINEFRLDINDTTYTLNLDSKLDTNTTFLKIKCHFNPIGENETVSLHFPTVHFDNYYFDYSVSRIAYLRFKYKKQIAIFKMSMIVVVLLGLTLTVFAISHKIVLTRQLKYDSYALPLNAVQRV